LCSQSVSLSTEIAHSCFSYIQKPFQFGNIVINLSSLETSSTDYDLTGQVVWKAAHILCQYIVQNSDKFRNKRVLELGSGAGLPGLLVSHYAKRTVLTDHNKIVLELLQKNISINNLQKCDCRLLEWANENHLQQLEPNSFDFIIGSDIVFWRDSIPALLITVDRLLSLSPKAQFILSYQSRALSTENFLFDKAKQMGFASQFVPLESFYVFGNDEGNDLPKDFNRFNSYFLVIFQRQK
jgi:predicted nicotinamide N-methyase